MIEGAKLQNNPPSQQFLKMNVLARITSASRTAHSCLSHSNHSSWALCKVNRPHGTCLSEPSMLSAGGHDLRIPKHPPSERTARTTPPADGGPPDTGIMKESSPCSVQVQGASLGREHRWARPHGGKPVQQGAPQMASLLHEKMTSG